MKERLLEFLRLKQLARSGWVRRGVEQPESVAAHSWGVATLVALLCPPELDRERALCIALLHDLAEVRVGDLTPYDGIDKVEKERRERAALEELLAESELLELALSYQRQDSDEARFVRFMDKLDMALQAQRYQRDQELDLQEFLVSAEKVLADSPWWELICE